MATIRTAIELEDRLSGVLNNVLDTVSMTVSAIEKMNRNLDKPIEASYFDGIRDNIADTSVDLQNLSEKIQKVHDKAEAPIASVPAAAVQPVAAPIHWQSDSLNVFTNTGIERFRQEIQSTETMLHKISESQLNIAANSEQTSVFPAAMTSDMQNMQARITAIQNRVREIGSKPVKLVTAADCAMLEQLRGQLAGITGQQETLNAAVEAMDVSEANRAYLQLSQTVGNTERYIRDNAAEQEKFNKKIDLGISGSDRLTRSIKSAAAAYISVQSLGKVLNLSDDLTQTTARLNMMNDGQQTTAQLQEMIFQSAQRSRGAYQETADAVAKLGLMAGDAFGSSAEVVAFMEQVNKQFRIAGTGADGVRAAMLQLTQAMGSGVLRGEEFNSIFEQAPTIMQSIADYLEVPIGQLRNMAAEGEITAGVVKAAMFAAADETNARFESMPMTFEQVWTSFENQALMAFQPVMDRLSEIANSDRFQEFADNAADSLADVADAALDVLNGLIDVANFVSDNWSDIAPLIESVATAMLFWKTATGLATVAQNLYNASLQACPIVWIIDAIALAIVLGIAFDRMINSVMGNIVGGVYVVRAFFDNCAMWVANLFIAIGKYLKACWNNMLTGFNNTWVGVQKGFWFFVENFLKGIVVISDKINSLVSVFGIEIDTSGMLEQIDNIAAKRQELENQTKAFIDPRKAWNEGWSTFKVFEDGWADKAYKQGEIFGNAMSESHDDIYENVKNGIKSWIFGAEDIGGMAGGAGLGANAFLNDDFSDLYQGVYNIDENTGSMADSLSVTDEELKYLRDIAERETINRFTTAEINFDMSGMQNTVNNDNDIDGILTKITDAVIENVFIAAEGVHA